MSESNLKIDKINKSEGRGEISEGRGEMGKEGERDRKGGEEKRKLTVMCS